MGFDIGRSIKGGVKGGVKGGAASGGNPYVAAIAAAIGALQGGFSDEEEQDPAQMIGGGSGEDPGMGDILNMAKPLLQNALGGGAEEEAPASPVLNPGGAMQSPSSPQLLGFPSLQRKSTIAQIREAMAARQPKPMGGY